MKQIRVHGPDDVRLDDIDPPDPGSRDVVLQVAACGICGSDVSWVHMGGLAGPTDTPMPLGHELAGVVEWVGADVDDISARRPGHRPSRERASTGRSAAGAPSVG